MNALQRTDAVLSHAEASYRPGDRQLAISLFEAMGCKIYETDVKGLAGSTYVSAHPDPAQRTMDNVLYLSEMTSEQSGLEDVLRQRIETDPELRAARDRYRALASEKPFGLAHIAVRYPSYDVLEQVLAGLAQRLTPEMKERTLVRIFRPGDAEEIQWDSIQAFIYTDIAVSGIAAFGQVYELSAYGEWT
jgi:hypothetical protein